jgi:nitrous oxide reductase accessory protein NosL
MKNLVLLSVVFAAFIFAGCAGNTVSPADANQPRFQTVKPEQAVLLQKGKDNQSCKICGMNLVTFYKTNHAARAKDGMRQYCSLHCVVEDNEINKTDLADLQVVDAKSLKFIPADRAFYVVGSSKPGTMTKVSQYAFAQKADAQAFTKENGGKIMKLDEAYGASMKDFSRSR